MNMLENLVLLDCLDLTQHEGESAETAMKYGCKRLLMAGWKVEERNGIYLMKLVWDTQDNDTDNLYWTIPKGVIIKEYGLTIKNKRK